MQTSFLSRATVQIHLSRFCNLSCRHCYTASGPEYQGRLDLVALLSCLKVLRQEGYEVLSLSGGEPLLYPELPSLLEASNEMGFETNLVTNGMVVSDQSLDLLQELQFVGVSLDGLETHHDWMRNRLGAFRCTIRNMRRMQSAGIAFGVNLTVTQANLGQVVEVYELCESVGAKALQLHVLNLAGRARQKLQAPTLEGCSRVYTIGKLLNATGALPHGVQVDVAPVRALADMLAHMPIRTTASEDYSLATLVNPLVIDEAGSLLPLVHGISDAYAMANLNSPVEAGLASWRADGIRGYVELLRRVSTALSKLPEFSHLDPYDLIASTATTLDLQTASPRALARPGTDCASDVALFNPALKFTGGRQCR